MRFTSAQSPLAGKSAAIGLYGPYLLALLISLLYLPLLSHPFIAFDDSVYILANPQVVSPSLHASQLTTPAIGWMTPITVNLQALLYAIGGGSAFAFHLCSLLLHIAFCLQLLRLCRSGGASNGAALMLAALFAVHPLNVQTVAWAICLKDLLMANLALAATSAWLRLLEQRAGKPNAAGTIAITCVALAVAAMLSKPPATVIAAAWALHLYVVHRSGNTVPRSALLVVGVVLVGGLSIGVIDRGMHDELVIHDQLLAERPAGTALAVLGSQVSHLLWPASLHPHYELDLQAGLAAGYMWLGIAALLMLALAAAFASRQPWTALWLAAAAAFYFPVSNIIPFPRMISDSYMYMPFAAILLSSAPAVRRLHSCDSRRSSYSTSSGTVAARTAMVIAAMLLIVLSLRSFDQLNRWRGGDLLWGPVVAAMPQSSRAHALRGYEAVFLGNSSGAVAAFRRVFDLGYDRDSLMPLSVALAKSGDTTAAECVMLEAIKYSRERVSALRNYAVLISNNPNYAGKWPQLAAKVLPGPARLERFTPGGASDRRSLLEHYWRATSDSWDSVEWPRANCPDLR